MKKIYSVALLSFVFLFLFSPSAQAYAPGCTANNNTTDPAAWDSVKNKPIGLVPCGISSTGDAYSYVIQYNLTQKPPHEKAGQVKATSNNDARQQVEAIAQSMFSANNWKIKSVTLLAKSLDCPCEIGHFFMMILRVYNFAVWIIAVPLAGLMIVIGGIMLLISAGNQGWAEKGKNILIFTSMGLLLIFGSWLIINVVLKTIGYVLPWSSF